MPNIFIQNGTKCGKTIGYRSCSERASFSQAMPFLRQHTSVSSTTHSGFSTTRGGCPKT